MSEYIEDNLEWICDELHEDDEEWEFCEENCEWYCCQPQCVERYARLIKRKAIEPTEDLEDRINQLEVRLTEILKQATGSEVKE